MNAKLFWVLISVPLAWLALDVASAANDLMSQLLHLGLSCVVIGLLVMLRRIPQERFYLKQAAPYLAATCACWGFGVWFASTHPTNITDETTGAVFRSTPSFDILALLIMIVGAFAFAQANSSGTFVAGGATGACVLVGPSFPVDLLGWRDWALIMLTSYAVAYALAAMVRSNRQRRYAMSESVRSREREHLARELHDLVAHEVTGMVVLAQALAPQLNEPNQRAAVERIASSGQQALSHMRTLVASLQSLPTSDGRTVYPKNGADLIPGLSAMTEQFQGTTSAALHVAIDPALGTTEMTAAAATTVHRVASEALTNVRRHAADARNVWVCLDIVNDQVHMTIQDDGSGGGLGSGNRLGLRGMDARAVLVGGQIYAGPTAGWNPHPEQSRQSLNPKPLGWTVHAMIPTSFEHQRHQELSI